MSLCLLTFFSCALDTGFHQLEYYMLPIGRSFGLVSRYFFIVFYLRAPASLKRNGKFIRRMRACVCVCVCVC